jgi:hypothetical protein
MKETVFESIIVKSLFSILALVILFHLFVLLRIVPYEIVWGGRINTTSELLFFESASLLLNGLMLVVVAVKAGWLKLRIPPVVIQIALWAMCGLFLLNTLGNLLSTNAFEKTVFTPLTLVLSLLCFILATRKRHRRSYIK